MGDHTEHLHLKFKIRLDGPDINTSILEHYR